jgi:glutathione S-transferase
MLTLHGDIRSGNCLKAKWLLDLIGPDYLWIETDVTTGATRTPEFLALNPAGQVPLLVLDDGRTLAQSNAILLYLAADTDLVPQDAYERGRM